MKQSLRKELESSKCLICPKNPMPRSRRRSRRFWFFLITQMPRAKALSLALFHAISFGAQSSPLFSIKLFPNARTLSDHFAFAEFVLKCSARIFRHRVNRTRTGNDQLVFGLMWMHYGRILLIILIFVIFTGGVCLPVFMASKKYLRTFYNNLISARNKLESAWELKTGINSFSEISQISEWILMEYIGMKYNCIYSATNQLYSKYQNLF